MQILLEPAQSEIEVKKSRFLGFAYPIEQLSQIKDIVAQERSLHPGANHVVHAAVLGPMGDVFSYSDDHEPKNTAGRPALEVLKGSGITNILILVVRYFGGTLLGTGGLVKAYGDSVKELLLNCKTEELVQKTSFTLTIPYNLYDLVLIHMEKVQATIINAEFTTIVTIKGTLPSFQAQALDSYIVELTQGKERVAFNDD